MKTLLIELGVAELPTAAVESLSQAFLQGMQDEFAAHNIAFSGAKRFATARRLAVQFDGVSETQADQEIEKRGPALKAAKDADGDWTKAASGFAASCGVSADDLVVEETPKGEWLFYRGIEKGQAVSALIPALFKKVMDALPIAKRMRWGDRDDSFMRPVITLVMMLDDEIVDAEFFGVQSGRTTLGHRFHGDKMLEIATASAYETTLANSYVIADIDKRKQEIVSQVTQLVGTVSGAQPVLDESVLDEVNALVEHPVAILGSFDERYQHIPQEVLIKTMQDNQKYFAVIDEDGKILPRFVTISNIESADPEVVRVGNQRVIEPRFADAEFFWENDKKKTLESRRESLKQVVYQDKLGSIYDRSSRVADIARFIADAIQGNADNAVRAAQLAKCDLVSEMVFEFGELQGVIGEYYARHDGESNDVASAIREHYLPKFAGDALPVTETGLIVALADRIENIVGGFAVGAKPTGAKDPYAIRRASLGVIRLLNETSLDLPLREVLEFSSSVFSAELNAAQHLDDVQAYITERLKGYFQERGIRYDVFDAVSAIAPEKISDIDARCVALTQFLSHDSADDLFAGNKRMNNILKKSGDAELTLNDELLSDEYEIALSTACRGAHASVSDAVGNNDYAQALSALATLRQPLDAFFENVMVMADDEAVKNNRLALLMEVRALFLFVADFSLINASQ